MHNISQSTIATQIDIQAVLDWAKTLVRVGREADLMKLIDILPTCRELATLVDINQTDEELVEALHMIAGTAQRPWRVQQLQKMKKESQAAALEYLQAMLQSKGVDQTFDFSKRHMKVSTDILFNYFKSNRATKEQLEALRVYSQAIDRSVEEIFRTRHFNSEVQLANQKMPKSSKHNFKINGIYKWAKEMVSTGQRQKLKCLLSSFSAFRVMSQKINIAQISHEQQQKLIEISNHQKRSLPKSDCLIFQQKMDEQYQRYKSALLKSTEARQTICQIQSFQSKSCTLMMGLIDSLQITQEQRETLWLGLDLITKPSRQFLPNILQAIDETSNNKFGNKKGLIPLSRGGRLFTQNQGFKNRRESFLNVSQTEKSLVKASKAAKTVVLETEKAQAKLKLLTSHKQWLFSNERQKSGTAKKSQSLNKARRSISKLA